MKIIDAQVNFGENLFGQRCDIEQYIQNAQRIGITEALLIPTGTHVLGLEEGIVEKSCIWKITSEGLIYEKIIIKDCKESKIKNPVNPYTAFNNYVLDIVRNNNQKGAIHFYFVPKIHPKLDKPEEIERLLKKEETVALKLQGLATYCCASDMPLWIPELLKTYNKPLMVHTDYLGKDSQNIQYPQGIKDIMQRNNPLDWAVFGIQHNVRLYLAHGIRLDEECAKFVNESDNLVVGLGPDAMIEYENWRLKTKTEDYISDLFKILDESKVLFSTDFAWNLELTHNRVLDWFTVDRLKKYAKTNCKNDSFLKKVLYTNTKDFFNLGRIK